MAGLCEGGNEPSGSLKAICKNDSEVRTIGRYHNSAVWCHLSTQECALKDLLKVYYSVLSQLMPSVTILHHTVQFWVNAIEMIINIELESNGGMREPQNLNPRDLGFVHHKYPRHSHRKTVLCQLRYQGCDAGSSKKSADEARFGRPVTAAPPPNVRDILKAALTHPTV
ncbi:hypothetical protein ANN_15276 [Periplaneta americana]|uniref:Uncharacterized protein n=1 Tax=Periplaneta americana TaxID=6978 RepID=A0ABQ8SFX3_PERAM|nr:hypothetical protein ANN_15276 [Periplaneta americana]